jgi:hypothetical protein
MKVLGWTFFGGRPRFGQQSPAKRALGLMLRHVPSCSFLWYITFVQLGGPIRVEENSFVRLIAVDMDEC